MKLIRWCVGNFSHVKGLPEPIHFMALRDYHIDQAVELTLLFSLRALRLGINAEAFREEALTYYLDRTEAGPLASLVRRLLNEPGILRKSEATVAEIFPGLGLTFEYLKFLEQGAESVAVPFRYAAWGEGSDRSKFTVLHEDDTHPYDFYSCEDPSGALATERAADLVILNHPRSLHLQRNADFSIEEHLEGICATGTAAVLAARASPPGSGAKERLTVKGREVSIQDVDGLRETCRRTDPHWCFRFLPDFDHEFFFPDPPEKVGLFLAYTARRPLTLDGFEAA